MKKPTIAPPSPPTAQRQLQFAGNNKMPILQPPPKVKKTPVAVDSSDEEEEEDEDDDDEEEDDAEGRTNRNSQQCSNHLTSGQATVKHLAGSKGQLHSPLGSAHSFDLQVGVCFL